MNEEQLRQRARRLLSELAGNNMLVRSCAVVSYDGLMRASLLASEVDAERFAAMCASMLALASRMVTEGRRGLLRQVIMDGEHGPMLLTAAGNAGVLAIVGDPSPNLGRLILDARAVASALAALQVTPNANRQRL